MCAPQQVKLLTSCFRIKAESQINLIEVKRIDVIVTLCIQMGERWDHFLNLNIPQWSQTSQLPAWTPRSGEKDSGGNCEHAVSCGDPAGSNRNSLWALCGGENKSSKFLTGGPWLLIWQMVNQVYVNNHYTGNNPSKTKPNPTHECKKCHVSKIMMFSLPVGKGRGTAVVFTSAVQCSYSTRWERQK